VAGRDCGRGHEGDGATVVNVDGLDAEAIASPRLEAIHGWKSAVVVACSLRISFSLSMAIRDALLEASKEGRRVCRVSSA
jgi:predicted transcriptional regulator